MIITRFDEASTFAPHGHEGVLNRELAGRALHGADSVSVWWGTFAPEGTAGQHVHQNETQVYVVLSGEFSVGGEVEQHTLARGDAALIPPGEPHWIRALSEGAEVLVITTPALR